MLRDPDMCKVNLGRNQQHAAVAGWGSECVFGFRVGASMIPETVFRINGFFTETTVFFTLSSLHVWNLQIRFAIVPRTLEKYRTVFQMIDVHMDDRSHRFQIRRAYIRRALWTHQPCLMSGRILRTTRRPIWLMWVHVCYIITHRSTHHVSKASSQSRIIMYML